MPTTGIATGFYSLPVETIKVIFEIRQEFPLALVNGYQSMRFWEHVAPENIGRRSVLINFLDNEILNGVMALMTLFLAGTKESITLPFLQLLATVSGPYISKLCTN
ncbi:hypothetical protein M422DRAFT_243063 [Sphaerobolus stellatus SS14]|nr:hypothetical protein M422DRAFT_243063 [Sphaerobolus stellatus SS14]